ncbi:DUF1176 domain-containing protein [Kosakonia sp. MUSA4]|uniref:DUF1176 domain-containing protein n=1 Tax=Kosakonia sp. MUSA4 TaxID=2067958 RepID=UPI00159AE114|nr:DUF1176 domain-containing protein [Kosakonia sp. MUSA4]QJT78986.1 DUF1176 domain-containing protein [Kosakonia sp. MUSA4]
MNSGIRAALVMAATLSAPALAEQSGISFDHKDWEVVCDNTLTCRAAGYSAEEEASGSVLITRKAGPDMPITVDVVLAEMDADETAPQAALSLWIDGKSQGEIATEDNDTWRLSDAQAHSLIDAVKGSAKVEFKGAAKPFVLSGDGAYAVLLKFDDVQGRVGTPGALSKKGDKAENTVTPAVAAPVIQAAKVESGEDRALTAAEVNVLKPRLLAALPDNNECEGLASPQEPVIDGDNDITLTPLDRKHVLISALCWRGAYNEGYGYWVLDKALKGNPQFITNSASDYADGIISLGQRGRGIGDCWASAEWVWDGETFRKSSESTTGMCRYIRAGGTWDLPEFVTEVKEAQ